MRFAFLILISLPAAVFAQTIDWSNPAEVAARAESGHPLIVAIEAERRAVAARVMAAGAYPNPMLMTGVENQPVDLSDDMMTMYVVGASQSFPRREKRRVARTIAELDLARVEAEKARVRAELRREALLLYWSIAAADSKLRVLEQMKSAADMLIDAARVRYEIGPGAQSDIVRAQLERTRIDHQILSLSGARASAAARLTALLGVEESVPHVQLSHDTALQKLPESGELVNVHPLVAGARAQIDRGAAAVVAARLALAPDIEIEATYGMRPYETDMFSVMARIELPVRRKTTIEPLVRESIALREKSESELVALQRAIRAGLGAAAASHDEATKQLHLHEQVLLPQSRLAFESALATYQTGANSYGAVADAYNAMLAVELEYFDYLEQHIAAIVDYEALRDGAVSSSASQRGATGSVTTRSTRSAEGMEGMR